MHSTVFHFPFSKLSYLITSLSAPDVLSICNPVFQLRAEYTYLQLSNNPVRDEDINWEWIQISGSTPLDFVNTNTRTPTVIADPNIVNDAVFRVYIDRGSDTEWFADMTVYRTPTENATTVLKSDIDNLFRSSLAVNGQSYDNSFVRSLISPTDVTTLPSILTTFDNNDKGILSTDNATFTAVISYPKSLYTGGHKIESISAYDPNTGALIASTNYKSNIIEIPLNVSVFYLTFDVSLNYFNPKLPTKRVFISDTKVRSSYLKQYTKEIRQLHLYVTEGIASKVSKELVNSLGYNQIKNVSLPQSLQFLEDAALSKNDLTNSPIYNSQIQKYSALSKIAPDELAALVNKKLSKTSPNNYVVTRFNGISIGG